MERTPKLSNPGRPLSQRQASLPPNRRIVRTPSVEQGWTKDPSGQSSQPLARISHHAAGWMRRKCPAAMACGNSSCTSPSCTACRQAGAMNRAPTSLTGGHLLPLLATAGEKCRIVVGISCSFPLGTEGQRLGEGSDETHRGYRTLRFGLMPMPGRPKRGHPGTAGADCGR